jgi:hypothetical protein
VASRDQSKQPLLSVSLLAVVIAMSEQPTALPPSLTLPPHLSAHKYFFVCTLTIAAWDTLVLSPRTWRLLKTQGWPILKISFHVLRLLMVGEFIAVGKTPVPIMKQ